MGQENDIASDKKFLLIEGAAAAGTSALDSDVIDMGADNGYSEVVAMYHIGTITDTGAVELEAYGSDNSDGSSATLLGTSGVNTYATGADGSNKLLVLAVIRPPNRYVYFKLKRTVANVVLASGTAILGGSFGGPGSKANLIGTSVVKVLGR